MESSKVEQKLKSALDEATTTRLGRETGLTERIRVVTPHGLALSLIDAMAGQRVETIADVMRRFIDATGNSVQYKPFHKQLAKPAFSEFMRKVLCHLMSKLVLDVLRPKAGSPLAKFEDILLHDGSSFAVHDALAERFPGRFTKHSPAAVELHATMSLLQDTIIRVTLTADTTGERSQLPAAETLRNKLIIKDRGYEDRERFAEIMAAGGSFLVRCKTNANPFVEECRVDGRRIRPWCRRNLADFRHKLAGKDAGLNVCWRRRGQDVKYRVVLVWNPIHKAHMVLATNLSAVDFDVAELRRLYAVRWQIELASKEWKSYASLRKFNTRNPAIVQGLIWAALAAALLKRFLAHAAQHVHRVATSTRIAAMCAGEHVRAILKAAISGAPLIGLVRAALAYIADAAPRAHPRRDAVSGRLSASFEVAVQHGV
jgi:hypothetical protein